MILGVGSVFHVGKHLTCELNFDINCMEFPIYLRLQHLCVATDALILEFL